MTNNVFIYTGVVLALLMLMPAYRSLVGPTVLDRLLGVNAIGSKTIVMLILIGLIYGRVDMFVDIALAYAMLNFIAVLAASRYFQKQKGLYDEGGGDKMALLITLLLACGLLFFAGGSVGIIRFPDFYSRLHPAGKLDTGGLVITLSAFALYTLQPLTLAAVITSLKILLIVVFVFITSPTAIHSMVDAGSGPG